MQWVDRKPSALYLVDSKNLLSIWLLHGYELVDVAKLCEVPNSTVQQWWKGERSIPIDCSYKIAEELGIRI